MKSTMKRNLTVGFGASLLILIVSSIASYSSINNLLESSALVEHTEQVESKLEKLISTIKDAETGQRGYLLTGLDTFLEPYTGSYEKTLGIAGDIKTLTADNAIQQKNIIRLELLVKKRFSKLQAVIDKKIKDGTVDVNDLKSGKLFMDSVRMMVSEMQIDESALLKRRTDKLNRFASYTPVLVLASALIALIITGIYYVKMVSDLDIKTKLQEELLHKDAVISHRIKMIHNVSEKIAAGDYSTRAEDIEKDELGSISVSLNKMAASLETSFNTLSEKQWVQAGLAGLSEAIVGNEQLHQLGGHVLSYMAAYTKSQVGAFYMTDNQQHLKLENTFALSPDDIKQSVEFGDGAAGQAALSKKQFLLSNIKETDYNISFASAGLKPSCIIVIPVLFENNVNGVIELGALHQYTDAELAFLKASIEMTGIAVNNAQNRQRVQELLEQTQSQAEELMSQQAEMEQINTELEEQAQQLQSSEEELKVQTEELIETNTLLEERSSALEQRNQLIIQKNSEIEKKAEALALSTKYKSEFLANMSHELRTPLNSILLLSRLMSENNEHNLTDDQVQYANVIQSSGKGLLQLIDEILDLSKIESGKMVAEYQPVKMDEITSGLNALFEPLANEQQLQWKINTGAEVPAIIETDKLRLEQVLKNLLSNAFKFTSNGYVHMDIHSAADRPGFICFTVKDSGIGISPDKQELIFEAFQQEDGSTRRKYGGTGLGLSISRELAKLLGGEIRLASTPGQGSSFTICIPAKPGIVLPALERVPVTEDTTTTREEDKYVAEIIPAEIADDRNSILATDKVILIIEDDVHFAAALLDYARQKDYKGVVAVRGDKGIDMAKKYMPAGILLDLQLPVKSGWDVMAELKSNIHTRHIPVHMMSSFEVKKESLMKGAVNFINKPVAFEQLNTIFDKIEYILSKKEKKVLIVEENYKHAKALGYYLGTYNVNTEIYQTVDDSVASLYKKDVDCVILDMSSSEKNSDQLLETIRKNDGLQELPIIVFTGKSLSQLEEFKLKKYADAIVMKTANSYQRILDEVSLFLHLVHEQQAKKNTPGFERSVLQENVLKDKNVLLADDDVRNIYSMTKSLEKYQMNVLPAMDGKEALEMVQSAKVDVVLMDMMMPQMDGYESIRSIRKIPAFKSLPIIAVTAKTMSGDREKCIAAGASDYISKPVDIDQLISLLRIWLYEKGY